MARGLLGQYSPIQPRQKRGEALQEADVVILAGIYIKVKGYVSKTCTWQSNLYSTVTLGTKVKWLYKTIDCLFMISRWLRIIKKKWKVNIKYW